MKEISRKKMFSLKSPYLLDSDDSEKNDCLHS